MNRVADFFGRQADIAMVLGVTGVLMVLFVLIVNQLLGALPHEGEPWSLQRLLGQLLMPVAWLAGIPWSEAGTAGSLLGTKLLMAGHNVTLVCRKKTAELINRDGTEVRIKLRDEAVHRAIFSRDLPGKLDATEPQTVDISRYDLVALAMQEPQYTNHTVRVLMVKIAAAGLPCLSIMNMPPLPYLKRIPALAGMQLEEAYTNAAVWERFEPGLVSLCSPDPQAFRPPEEAANVLHVGLPTNFKAAAFADEKHNKLLRELEESLKKGGARHTPSEESWADKLRGFFQ